jgi:hypothetical protein
VSHLGALRNERRTTGCVVVADARQLAALTRLPLRIAFAVSEATTGPEALELPRCR